MKWNKNAASQKGRVFRSGLLSTAMLAAVLVLAVLLNLLVRAIPAKYTEFDLSEAKMYTLSDSTKALVEGLEKDVHIYYLCETGSEDTIITKLLDHYADESGHLSWEPHLCRKVWRRECFHRQSDRHLWGEQHRTGCRRPVRVRLYRLLHHRLCQRDFWRRKADHLCHL